MLHQVIVSVDKNEKGKIITSNIAADVMGNKNKALKNLISGINNAKSILYIRNEIKDGPSGYSRPPSGARGSTLNTQLHPSGNLIIEDSRRVGKDVAGGEGRGKCIPPLVAGALWTSPAGLRVDGPLGRRFLRGLSLTRLWREGCCRAPMNR